MLQEHLLSPSPSQSLWQAAEMQVAELEPAEQDVGWLS